MENNNHKDDELKDLAPNLFRIKKENPFSVPENYFESLPTIIQERCVNTPAKEYVSWFRFIFKPAYSLSFLIIVMALIGGIGYYLNNETEQQPLAMSVSENFDLEEVDESVIIDELAFGTRSPEAKNSEDFEDYLIEQNVELSQIESEL